VTLRVYLREPSRADGPEFLAFVHASRSLHAPYVDAPETSDTYRSYIQQCQSPRYCGFLVCVCDGDAIVGVVNFNEIVRDDTPRANLGMYGARRGTRKGYMGEGLQLALARAFGELSLHTVEADVQEANDRSVRLLESCGFLRGDDEPRLLRAAGSWKHHARWRLTAEKWMRSQRSGVREDER